MTSSLTSKGSPMSELQTEGTDRLAGYQPERGPRSTALSTGEDELSLFRLSAHDEDWKVGLERDRGAPWGLRDVEGRLEA